MIWSGVLAFGLMACGGVEPVQGEAPEATESAAQLQSESSELNGACESLIGTFCNPRHPDRFCYWSDGAEGNCYCQSPPFNKWVCDYNG
ncbi:hypothetical protein [Myxococcus hansupus]|nr:hypothetical protein [Myxococcus hansupus]